MMTAAFVFRSCPLPLLVPCLPDLGVRLHNLSSETTRQHSTVHQRRKRKREKSTEEDRRLHYTGVMKRRRRRSTLLCEASREDKGVNVYIGGGGKERGKEGRSAQFGMANHIPSPGLYNESILDGHSYI